MSRFTWDLGRNPAKCRIWCRTGIEGMVRVRCGVEGAQSHEVESAMMNQHSIVWVISGGVGGYKCALCWRWRSNAGCLL